jgi:hypothetical protein
MPNINNLLLKRLLNEWLEEWKAEKAPSRFVDKWGESVPEYWYHKLEEKVSEDWLNRLLETRDAIQAFDKQKEKHKYDELRGDLKKQYQWVDSMNAGKIWDAHADDSEKPQNTITWKDFLSQVVEVLLAKTHRFWDESEIELLYPPIKLKTEALVDGLIPNAYKAELYGRKQPQSWEDFLGQAIVLLLDGKRQWNQKKYPDISEQIKAVVSSLVSTMYKQHLIVKELYSDWAHKWAFLSSQKADDDENDEEKVQYTSSELDDIANKIDRERVENLGDEKPNLNYISGFNLGDDPELRWFANQLPKFIDVKNPSKHRINVVLKPNREIATGLNLSEQRVRELKKELKKKLRPYRDLLL